MSEIALQGLLDRTKADEQDEDAMDMTVINGIRMSKYDIRALRVGHKVTPELRNALIEFHKGFIGENGVFPVNKRRTTHIRAVQGQSLYPRTNRPIHDGQQTQKIAHRGSYLLPRQARN